MREQSSNEVSRRTRIFYGLGSMAEGTKDTAFNIFALFYYNNVLGLSGTLAGLAIFLALCVDALVDPLIGSLSDKTRSRWGRRHPYMYAAILPMPPLFWLVFNPPADLGAIGLFLWFSGFSVLLRACLSLYAVSSNAMVAEMTRRYDERTEVVGYRFLFGWLAGLSVAVAGYTGFFAPGADGRDGRLDPSAYQDFGLFCGVLCALGILLCAGGTHHLIPKLRQALPSQQGMRQFLRELREVLSTPSFRALFVSVIFSAAAWGYLNAVGYYMNTYFWGLSAGEIGLLSLSMFVSVFCAFGLAPSISRRFDKRKVAIGLKLFGLLLGPLPILLRYLGWMPENGTGALLALLFLHTLLLVTAVVSGQILGASMLADVTDQGEWMHRERREGLYAAVLVFAIQASTGLGGLLAGVSLDLARFPRQAEVQAISAGNVEALGYIVGPGVMLLFLASTLSLLWYDMNREGQQQVQRALAERSSG